MTNVRIAWRTDRGRVRSKNEDSVLSLEPLVAIADGMGGHVAGDVASSAALEVLSGWSDRLAGANGADALASLQDAFNAANRTVWERGREDPALTGMGTTLTACWLAGDTMAIAHVGDSRAYLLRGGSLQQLTEDQNAAQEEVRLGRISEEQARTSPLRHRLLQALGVEPEGLEIETATVALQPGDRILLASDGLFGMVKDPNRIRDMLVEHTDPDEACSALVDAANEAGGEDNISALIVDVVGTDAAASELPDDDVPRVVIERSAAAPKRSRSRRLAIGIVAGVVAVAAASGVGWFFLTRSSSPHYVVSARAGNVVVLDGRIGRNEGPAAGKVVKVFHDEPTDRFPSTTREVLRTGIPASSLNDAERIVDQLIRQLGPQDTPTPTPKLGASASPDLDSTLPPKTTKP